MGRDSGNEFCRFSVKSYPADMTLNEPRFESFQERTGTTWNKNVVIT